MYDAVKFLNRSSIWVFFFLVLNALTWTPTHSEWVQVGLAQYSVRSVWANGDTILAGCYGGLIFRSTDSGTNWTPCASNMPIRNIVTAFETNGTDLFATAGYFAFDTCTGCGGVYKSSDWGLTWQRSSSGIFLPDQVYSILVSGDKLFAASEIGLFRSDDSASSWMRLLDTVYYFLSLAKQENSLFAGTEDTGVYYSSDSGNGWQQRNTGLPPARAIDPLIAYRQEIFCGVSSNGIYSTTDSGGTWQPFGNGLQDSSIQSFSHKDTVVFVATVRKVHYLADNDSLWRDFSEGLSMPQSWAIDALTTNREYIFACLEGDVGGVWRRPLSELVSVSESSSTNPTEISLDQNYPNPFNSSTKIRFTMSSTKRASIKVYDVLGRELLTLLDETLTPGKYQVDFSAESLASGVYVYRLVAGEFSVARLAVLIK